VEYLRGFSRLRQDPDWLSKVGVGSLLIFSSFIIPIIGQVALAGWAAMIMRRATQGLDSPLPRLDLDFDYLGKLVGTGFKAFLATLLWTLPVSFLIGGTVACLYFGMFFGVAAAGDQGGLVFLCLMGVALPLVSIFAIVASMPAQMALIRAEVADDLNQAMRFGDVMEMTKKVARELIIGGFVLGFVQWLMMVGSLLLCYLPLIPSLVVMAVVRAHFGAQLYQLYLERGGTPVPVGPLEAGQPASAPAPTSF
jgi:hypothetical protein